MVKRLLVTGLCVLAMNTSALALEPHQNMPEMIPVKPQVQYSSAMYNVDGTTKLTLLNGEKIAAYYGIENPKSVSVTLFNKSKYFEAASIVSTSGNADIKNIKGPAEACGTKIITKGSATNRTDKTIKKNITLKGTVSNKYSISGSADIDISLVTLSAKIGFDVTKSWEMSDSTQVDLAPNETVDVLAYPLYNYYSFDVVNGSAVAGGEAGECIGFCTIVR